MRFHLFLTGIAWVCISQHTKAQADSTTLQNLVVTATQSALQQKQSGRNILTINGSQFASLPVQSLDEVLRYVPGIEVQQRGPQGSQADITLRGGTFQQVLVIIDGVKLNDPLTGHFNMYIPIHPAEIERIEVLKGAASAVWGSEAVGGVVHIISKTFAGKKDSNGITARAQAGEYGLLNGSLYIRQNGPAHRLSASVLSNNANGNQLRGTRSFFHLNTMNLSLMKQLPKHWTVSLRVAADYRNFNAQNYYTSFASDTAREKVNTGWGQVALQKKFSKGTLQLDAAYKMLRDQYNFRPSATPNDNKSNLLVVQAYFNGQINRKNGFTTGVQAIRKQIRSNDRGNHDLWHGAVYGILRHQPAKRLSLNESLRLDYDESYGAVLVPQFNIAWSPSRFTFRSSVGKSIRDADFTERYNNYNKTLVTSGRIGNPALREEYSWNAELGLDYEIVKKFKTSGTFFLRGHKNLIDWANTPYSEMPRKVNLSPTGTYALAKNVASVTTRGFELDLSFTHQTNSGYTLLVNSGLTCIKSENKDSIPSLYIASHARFLANLGISLLGKHWGVSATALGKKRDQQKASAINAALSEGYLVVNMRASYQFARQKARVYVQADNLFDTTYADLLGATMPGRWLSAGFEVTLHP